METGLFHSGPLFAGGVDADYYRNEHGQTHRVRRDGTVEFWTCGRWSLTDPVQTYRERLAEQGRMAL